jgi:hypothetical protein
MSTGFEEKEISLKGIAVIPTYNEIENLPRIVELVRAQPGGWHILVWMMDRRTEPGGWRTN